MKSNDKNAIHGFTQVLVQAHKLALNILLFWHYLNPGVHSLPNFGNIGQPRMWLSEVPDQLEDWYFAS